MKQIATILCLMALLIGQKNFANDYCEPCFSWCDISYSLSADYLYWTVTRPENNSFSTGSPVNISFLQPNYHSGYRVAAGLYYNCVDFGVRYTSFNDTINFPSPIIDATTPITALDYHLNYQVVDLAFGYTRYFQCHRGYLKPYLGAKLAWIDEDTTYFFTQIRHPAIKTRAYGPMLGVEGSWELFHCWVPVSLVARGDISVLSGSFEFSGTTGGSAVPIFVNRQHSFVTVEDLYIGLGFDLCSFSCFDANLQIGYEAQLWNAIRTYAPNSFLNNNHSTLGLGGLVVHFGVMF